MISDIDKNFIRYDLKNYTVSQKLVDVLAAEKEYAIEMLYEDCAPATRFYDHDRDQWLKNGVNTEDKALEIIEAREVYDKKIERYQEKADVFKNAMQTLNDCEKDVIEVYYLRTSNHLKLSDEAFKKALHKAEDKLVNFIYKSKIDKQNKDKAARKEVLREQVKQFKGVI